MQHSVVFPGIGLGAILCRTGLLSQKMVVAASKVLATKAPALGHPRKPLLPDVEGLRELSVDVAKALIQATVEEGLAQGRGTSEGADELEEWIRV